MSFIALDPTKFDPTGYNLALPRSRRSEVDQQNAQVIPHMYMFCPGYVFLLGPQLQDNPRRDAISHNDRHHDADVLAHIAGEIPILI